MNEQMNERAGKRAMKEWMNDQIYICPWNPRVEPKGVFFRGCFHVSYFGTDGQVSMWAIIVLHVQWEVDVF